MSFAFRWPRPRWSRWRTAYGKLPGGVVLNRRAGKPGRKAPGAHMKTGLEPSLPGRPGIGGLREESAGRVEKPHAGFQPLTALDAAVLAGRDRISRPLGESGCPVCLQFPAQALGAFHDQRGDRRPQPVPVQSTQHPRSQATQPTMQRGGVRMSHSHAPDCLSKAGGVLRRLQIRRAGRLNHRPRVALVGDELNRQDAQAPLAYGADALRHRCLAVLHPTMPWPTGTPCDKPASINQRANRQAIRTRNLLADRFTFDSCGQQGIIGDGDGNWDSTLSAFRFSTRYGCLNTRTSLLPESVNATPPTPSPQTSCSQPRAHEHELFSVLFRAS